VVKQTNILGLDEITVYDQFERPIKHTDHWGNIKRIDYNDLHLITTTYINQHKAMEKETQPWLARTLHRKYPVFENPNDPQSYFIEETLEKNGFGQNSKHTSALIHRCTLKPKDSIQSVYTHDPSFNRISKTIVGSDGLHFTRTTEYDLFKNVVKHTKTQTKNDETHQNETDLREYNKDNQLVKVTTPEKVTTQHVNDKEGRRVKTILPDGSDILFEYNLLGQMVKNSWIRGGKRLEITKTYNDDNHLITLSDNDGQSIKYTYLPNGKVHTITYPDGQAMTRVYDDKNRVIRRTDFAGKRYHLTYNEDDKGALSEVQVDKNRIQFNYGEDDNHSKGSLISRTDSYDSTKGSSSNTETCFYYGAFRNLTKTTHLNKPTETIFNTNHHFNSRGQLKSITNHSHQGHKPSMDTLQTYQYDSLNRLIEETHEQAHVIKSINYRYDANNNLLSEIYHDGTNQHSITHQYNGQDQRTFSTVNHVNQVFIEHYFWDKNGHLEQTPSTTRFEYDTQGYLMTMKHPDFATIDYHYLPNGLLGKRTKNQKDLGFYHGTNKKITSIKDNNRWHSLFSDTHGLEADISNNSVAQFFVSGRDSGGILTHDKDFQTTTYTAYGKAITPFERGDISSAFGWNQEFLDQDANLTYLQRRFYDVGLKLFISRDTYHVDNHYAYAKGNPISFIDPTGHNAQQGVSYGVGSGLTALGIIGAVFAVPTGGASLTLTAGAGIAAGATAALSGIALMGSQAALDSGNKQAAKALQYTSIGLSAVALIEAGVAIAPAIAPSFFTSTSYIAYHIPEEAFTFSVSSTARFYTAFTANASRGFAESFAESSSAIDTGLTQSFYESIDQSLTLSGESQVSTHATAASVNSASGEYIPLSRLASPVTNASIEAGHSGIVSGSSSRIAATNGALYTRPSTMINGVILRTTPSAEVATGPLIPGAIATEESLSTDMSGANASFRETFFGSESTTRNFLGLDHSSAEEASPDGGL
jgi:RHS repeat-associated protein